jgi:hypothetical protein
MYHFSNITPNQAAMEATKYLYDIKDTTKYGKALGRQGSNFLAPNTGLRLTQAVDSLIGNYGEKSLRDVLQLDSFFQHLFSSPSSAIKPSLAVLTILNFVGFSTWL